MIIKDSTALYRTMQVSKRPVDNLQENHAHAWNLCFKGSHTQVSTQVFHCCSEGPRITLSLCKCENYRTVFMFWPSIKSDKSETPQMNSAASMTMTLKWRLFFRGFYETCRSDGLDGMRNTTFRCVLQSSVEVTQVKTMPLPVNGVKSSLGEKTSLKL